MALPFLLMDLATRFFGRKIHFFAITKLVPNFFTIIWIFLFLSICLTIKKKYGKWIYLLIFSIMFIFYLTHNVYYSMTSSFFDLNLMGMASEGSSYITSALKNCNLMVYIIAIISIILAILGFISIPKREHNNFKGLIYTCFIFIILHSITPLILGKANSDLSWNTWRNPRNIYINFNDSNKSMTVSGLYEYTFRNFYVTYFREKKSNNEEDLEFLNETFVFSDNDYQNEYTGLFKGKNIIFLQLEGVDEWLVDENTTPSLYKMMTNSLNFANHYSYYNGGGSTFNSEFAVNTGYITPISYTQNAYTFNKNTFTYSMARLFKAEGYKVNAFHMNSSEYYSRGINYENWGYDNYFGLKDLNYSDNSYMLDRELILNEIFYENMFPDEGNFVDYIISYSSHVPFSTTGGVCKLLVAEDMEKTLTEEEIALGYELPELTEEECVRRQARETDDMISMLLNTLEEKQLLDNTVIVTFTDHYLYTISDQSILDKYKTTENNLINKTPFFIYDNGNHKKTITEVTSQLNILPTVLNLFGLEYHPNYYIGEDALASSYKGYVFFSDYSWYDGNVYVDGGVITNGKEIDPNILEEKNNFINQIIKKNDLTLKYDYFKKISNHYSL